MIRFNPNPSIKSRFVGIFNSRYREKVTQFWALKDIDFRIMRGESVGIVGPNGSGKSTLFKLIAGIIKPSEGRIQTRGLISPLIELGVGFNPDLTGRENVYLNTTFYCISKKATDEIFPEILEFSEIGDFINVPIKNYSSGMIMRLAFSIAIKIVPDILLDDEVFSVGDASFQQKCLDWMRGFKERGNTIVLVSHNRNHVTQMCERSLLAWKGRIIADGPSSQILDTYDRVVSLGDPDWEGVLSV
ncbi:MAG: ABC transporter ATP-binding protein [Planctomycetota bacterium]